MGSDIPSHIVFTIASIAIATLDELRHDDASSGFSISWSSCINYWDIMNQSAKAPASALRSGTLLAPVIFVAMAYFIIDF